jgi:hypothetical protein
MQYTASSFAAPLVTSFRALLWPEREAVSFAGPFPERSRASTHVSDLAEKDFFVPLFTGTSRVFRVIKTLSIRGIAPPAAGRPVSGLQAGPLKTLMRGMTAAVRRGSIQVYIAFIVLTVVTLFLFERIFSGDYPVSTAPDAVPVSVDRGTIR